MQPQFSTSTIARFYAKVDRFNGDDPCWVWLGSRTPLGYGCFYANGKLHRAHRISYEMHVGPIADGLWILHRCDNPSCVNPHHLFPGTPAANSKDMVNKGRSANGPKRGKNVSYERHVRGERSPFAKLTAPDIPVIRQRYAAGNTSYKKLGVEYGVSAASIEQVIRRETWAHIP